MMIRRKQLAREVETEEGTIHSHLLLEWTILSTVGVVVYMVGRDRKTSRKGVNLRSDLDLVCSVMWGD